MQEFSSPSHPGQNADLSLVAGFATAGLSVAIASSVRLVREGLDASLRDREGIAAVYAVGLDADGLDTLARVKPDVVLVDLHRAAPAAAAQSVRAVCPSARLIAFALAEVADDVIACAAAGFHGYVSRDGGADDLHRAVLDTAQGRMSCAPHIAAAMFGRLADLLQPQGGIGMPPLTSRENEILCLAAEGCSNKEIARRLTISMATVKNHMHNILQKLRVTRRGQATALLRAAK